MNSLLYAFVTTKALVGLSESKSQKLFLCENDKI